MMAVTRVSGGGINPGDISRRHQAAKARQQYPPQQKEDDSLVAQLAAETGAIPQDPNTIPRRREKAGVGPVNRAVEPPEHPPETTDKDPETYDSRGQKRKRRVKPGDDLDVKA